MYDEAKELKAVMAGKIVTVNSGVCIDGDSMAL